jgi:D-alanyl-D-alanine dipeptidase
MQQFLCLALLIPVIVSLQEVLRSPEFEELHSGPALVIDLRYASNNNFTGQDLYGPFKRAFLHRIAAAKLQRAAELLSRRAPGHRLVVFDALRPRSVQVRLWNQVKGTSQQRYVADPVKGSIHNYGFAVDISVVDAEGNALDMGTPFDDFTPLEQPRLEVKFLKLGRLTVLQVRNRRLLRQVMEEAGFTQLPIEWWHFDSLAAAEVKSMYRIVE